MENKTKKDNSNRNHPWRKRVQAVVAQKKSPVLLREDVGSNPTDSAKIYNQ